MPPNPIATKISNESGVTTLYKTRCSVQPPPYGQYYVYSSGPKVASVERPKPKGNSRPRGAHDYHSLMWDPRIYRGPTYKTYKRSEEERCQRKSQEDANARNVQRKKALAKRKLEEQQTFANINNNQPSKNTQNNNQPQLSHQTTKIGLEDMGIQTDRFLEEITDEVIEKEIGCQTDQIFDLPVPYVFCPTKLGIDVATQIQPWELFSFDEEVLPIVNSLVGKIIEQALFETMEEVELESLLSQQRAFEEKHRIQLVRLERLHKREQKLAEEKARLLEMRQIEAADEKMTETIVTANTYAMNYLKGMSRSAVDELRRDGFISGNNDLPGNFIPWITDKSIQRTKRHANSTILLDEIIQAVVDTREAEIADGIWREISAEKKVSLHDNNVLNGEEISTEGRGSAGQRTSLEN